ncbi:MAG TPA: hypothetical protein VFZ65_07960 [Planctomycetota bacterium]|nr:hypothetical protein [Planctomycetota bacterium]
MRSFAVLSIPALVAGLLLLLWWCSWPSPAAVDPTPASPTVPAAGEAGTANGVAIARGAAATPGPSERTAADAAAAFQSVGEDGQPIADPARDGIVLAVRTAAGAACADLRIVARWRKGFGIYGSDAGRTDASGRFATTVAVVEQFEGVEVTHPEFGVLQREGDLLVSPAEPHTAVLVVPVFAMLRVQLVDGTGAPVAGGAVTCSGRAEALLVHARPLETEDPSAVTDDQGRCVLRVPIGAYELAAEAAHCSLPETVLAEVGPGQNQATIVLLRYEHRLDVHVRTTLPPGGTLPVHVSAFTREAPPRPANLPGRSGEGRYRESFVDRQSDLYHVVRAEPVPWRLVVAANGCADAVIDVPVGQPEVAVRLQPAAPPAPKARLHVLVVDPDGRPVRADVRVHEHADIVHGSDHATGADGRVELEWQPEGRVCVSARSSGFARAFAGPFDLVAGDLDVHLCLGRALAIEGRVVDRSGQPLEARVRLLRPAGVLGRLGGVGEILDDAPTDDWRFTSPDGVFRYDDCGPGEHELWAFADAGGLPAHARVRAGDTATLALGEGLAGLAFVTVTVRDAATRVAMAGADLQCHGGEVGWNTVSDAQGRFEFVARPGDVGVTVRAKDHVVTTCTRTMVAGREVLDVFVPPSPVLFLRLLDAAGRPLAGAAIRVLDAAGEPIELLDAEGHYAGAVETTNRAGRAEPRGAPAGAVRLRIEQGGVQREFDVPATAARDAVFDVRWLP